MEGVLEEKSAGEDELETEGSVILGLTLVVLDNICPDCGLV